MPLKKKKKPLRKKAAKKVPPKKEKGAKKKVRVSRRPKAKAAAAVKKPKEKIIGIVTHYFPHVNAAVIKLKSPLSVGDKIKIKGHTTDFVQEIKSMQIDRVPITSAKKGQEIGLLVDSRVRQHDVAYKA